MNRKRRTILFLITSWGVLLILPGVWLWQMARQEWLNQQLIDSIKQADMRSALRALKEGADANVHDEPAPPIGQRLWNILRRHGPSPFITPTPLLLLLQSKNTVPIRGGHAIPGPYLKEAPELVQALLAKGACVNICDQFGQVPMELALKARKDATARMLIEHGANVKSGSTGLNLLVLAIDYRADPGTVEAMLRSGADANQADEGGRTPLGEAVKSASPAVVTCLLVHHAKPDGKAADLPEARFPLEYAELNHLTEIAGILRNAGARP